MVDAPLEEVGEATSPASAHPSRACADPKSPSRMSHPRPSISSAALPEVASHWNHLPQAQLAHKISG